MTKEYMPIHSTNLYIKMSLLNEAQAQANHGQSLDRLADRGGLSPVEIVWNIKRVRWEGLKITNYQALILLYDMRKGYV